MINASDLRKGSKFMYQKEPFEVVDFQKFIMGRGRGNIRIKMKNMKNGRVLENTFSTDERFDYVDVSTREMQFLYFDGEAYIFMDNTNYEQTSFTKEQLHDTRWFLKDGESYKIVFLEGEPLTIDLPAGYPLEISETEPAVKGDSVTNIFKDALTVSGLKVKVPLFIKSDETVLVDTRTLEYLKRYND